MEKNNSPEKDGVPWITGQELREIYADDLSLDKYDEIRKRSVPAYEAMLAESLTEDQTRTLLMWPVRNKKEMFSQIVCPNCKEDVAEKAAAEAREEMLKLVWIEVQSCGVSREVFDGISRNIIAKSLRSGVKKP